MAAVAAAQKMWLIIMAKLADILTWLISLITIYKERNFTISLSWLRWHGLSSSQPLMLFGTWLHKNFLSIWFVLSIIYSLRFTSFSRILSCFLMMNNQEWQIVLIRSKFDEWISRYSKKWGKFWQIIIRALHSIGYWTVFQH